MRSFQLKRHPLYLLQKVLNMKKILTIFGIIVFIAMISYFYFDNESLELNNKIRDELGFDFVKTSNGFIHYEYKGSNKYPCIVLIHGYSSPMSTWKYQFSTLIDSGFNVLRYDLFGRGYSDRPNLEYDLDLFSEQLDHLLSSLDIETPVDLIGLSLGSHIATHFALKNKSKVRRIILLNPQITSLNSLLLELPLVGEYLMTTRVVPNLKYFQEQKKYKGFRRALLSTTREFAGINPVKKYEEISKSHSVALIWGKEDENIKFLFNDENQCILKDIELYLVNDAGHAAHFTRPEQTNSFIINFLKNK